ncbi:PAS domain S-box protein [Algoriphagus sp. D3-2-R+10]|uniref:PAS domain S-box protein n=1 Tax=Algoriphagus aurantiacus TaxID=3103948 RepID=UPI002B3A81E2|nr:PAS domain S-box protein [Algoriphagus sp. D3-2-R+10]MEB2778301.1 PAS domain S-box protein [Algoriphagus sp. D3-2-R+10]
MKKNHYSDLLLDQTKDLVWVVDRNLLLVYANKAYLNMMKEVGGVEKELNTPILVEGFGEGYIEKWKAYYQRALLGEYFETEEPIYNPETKEMQYGHIAFSPILDEPGKIQTVACRSTDITWIVKHKSNANQLMNASLDVFCTIDEAGKFVFVSAVSSDHWGYHPEELIGKPYRDLIIEEDLEKIDLVAVEIMAGRDVKSFSNRFRHKNGDIAYNLWSIRRDETSKLIYCVARDAKEKVEEEAKKELLNQISQSFNNEEELIPAANRLCENLYAFGKFDLIELWCLNMEQTQIKLMGRRPHNHDFYELEPGVSFQKNEGLPGKVWQEGKPILWDDEQINKYFIRKKGATHIGLQAMLGIPLTFNNELVGVLLISTKGKSDYLEQYQPTFNRLEKFIGSEINRKRLENDLKHLYQAIPDIICIADFNGRFLKMNPAGCELLGYKEDEILFHSCEKFVHPEDKHVSFNELEKLEKGASTFQFENRYITKSGKIIWLNWSCNSEVKEGLIYASAKNISREKKLSELNKQASSLAKIGSWEIDVVNDKLFWTDMVHVLHETDPLSFTPDLETGIHFYREDFRETVKQQVSNCLANGTPFNFEAVLVTAKNNERWVRVIGNPEFLNGKCIRVYGSFQDIHDRKAFDEALRESEANFRTIFEIASLGIVQASPANGRILFANSYFEEMTGYSHEALLQMKFTELTHPDDRKQDWDLFSKAARGEIEYRNEKRHIRKDGSIIWVRIHLAFIRDEGGNPIKTVAICENITERKEVESRLINLSDNVPGVVFQYVIYPEGKDELNFVSKGAKTIWGFEPEVAMANNQLIWDRIEAGGDLDLVKGSIADSIRNKSRWNATWKYPLPTGEIRTHIGHGSPEFLADGTVIFNSLILDITEEKRTEELLSQATNMARIGSWEMTLVDQKDDSMYWSPMTREILEVDDSYNPSLTGGFEFYAAEDKEKIQRAVNLLIETGQEFDLELLIITKSGKEKWIRCIGKCEHVNSKSTRIYGSFQDIQVAKSNELRVTEILESISDAFYSVDADWNFTYFNREAENLLKKSADEVLGGNIWEILSPAKGTILEDVYRRVASTGKSENLEYLYPGDGSWYELTAYPSKGGISSYFKNIDEHKKAIADLLKAHDEKNRIIESIGDAFFTMKEDFTVTYWNKSAEKLIGVKREDLVGRVLWDVFPDAIEIPSYENYHKVLEHGKAITFEDYYGVWLEVNAYPTEEGLSVFFRDISLRKEADQRLVKAFKEKNEILESIGDAFFAVDENWTVTYWNKQAEIVVGKKKEDVLGRNLWKEFPDAIDTDFYIQYHRAMDTGETVSFEEYYPTLDMWIEVTVYPSGNGLSIYFKDITLRKRADIRLLEANKRFEIITRATNDAIWDYNIVENTLFWGDGFKTMFGYEVDKITPTLESWISHIHPDDLEQVEKTLFEAIDNKNVTIWSGEYRYEKADGTFAFVYDKGIILRDQEGKAIRMLGALSDFTQLKKQEAELLEINESLKSHAKELERSNEELEQFAFITSHDLQEPLRMISSFMDQLKRKYSDQLDDKALQYIHYATDGAKRMKQIILDLLLYSRANKPSEELQEVDLKEIVSEYTQLRRKLIAEKNAAITFDVLPVLETYRAPLIQIIHCLLDNALKYVKEKVPPRVEILAKEKETYWEFSVKDNGIGIDKMFYDKIFIIFQRLHNRNQHDGTGIGLSIAKRSVEFLGGEIWLVSTVGEGSTFYFTIAK